MASGHRNSAVVLGASMGGLLAARVLADFYQKVTVVERDLLPDVPVNRRGVPQGRHPHALLGKAVEIIGDVFPGIFDQLRSDGAIRWDDGDMSRFWSTFAGHLMVRSSIPDPASLTDYHLSRPLLEHAVRRAVRKIPNIEFFEEHDFVGLTADTDHARIAGARVQKRGGTEETVIAADLVVDATGRGSRTPVFLEELGYPRPREDEIEVRIAYATVPVRIPRGTLHELVVTNYPIPSRPTMFAMFACENDMYLVLGGGVGGQAPPADVAELLDLAATLAPSHVTAALQSAEVLGDLAQYRIPSNRWRRYDKLARLPAGLIVFGDSICSFNPIYGQGMTVAAIEAEVLRDCLRKGNRNLPRRFYGKSAERIRVAWRTAVGSDLLLPQVPGRRPLSVRVMNSYMDRVLTAAETDPLVAQQFFRVVQMLDHPSALLRPHLLRRMAKAAVARGEVQSQSTRARIRNRAAFAATLDLITNRKGDMTVGTTNAPGRLDVFGPIVEFLTPEGDEQVCVVRAVIPPGVTVPLHSHDDFEDFYILAGGHQVLVHGDDGPQWRDVHAGDYVRVPADVPHALRNVSAEPAVDLMITTARMDEFFREVGRPVGSPPPTAQEAARFAEVAKRYGYLLATPDENAAVGITPAAISADVPRELRNFRAAT